MQQGSKFAPFILTELVYRVFGILPPPLHEPSLFHSNGFYDLSVLVFYMDDFFGGFKIFEKQYDFLRVHSFPRIKWVKFKLFFKKFKLFIYQIKTLGVSHTIGSHIKILENRITKIIIWKIPTDRSTIRVFLNTVGITRKWVKNFTEITRPLSRLTGKVDWKWGMAEQLFFEIFKIKCANKTSMYGMDYQLPPHFYTDVSGFGAGLVIIQFQMPSTVDFMAKRLVEMPIILLRSYLTDG